MADTPSAVPTLSSSSHALLAAGRLEEAYMACHHALSRNPADEDVLITLANVLHQLGELDTGLQHTLHALSLAPHRMELYVALTELAVASHQQPLAIDVLRQAQTASPRSELWWLEALVYKSLRQSNQALTALRQALAVDPMLPQARFELGALLFELGKLDAACECFEQLCVAHPNHVESLLNLGICQSARGQLAAAQHALEQALEQEPTRAGIWLALGNLAQQSGDFAKAIASYQQAQVLAPNDGELCYHFGLALYKAGQTSQAVELFTKADALNPNNAKPALAVAGILMETQQFEAALHRYENLVQRFPHNTQAMASMAQALDECGRSQEARYYYQRLLIAEPSPWEWRLAFGRSIPVIAQKSEDIVAARERLASTLEMLSQQPVQLSLDNTTILPDVHPPFYLPYQPHNERPLREAYASLMQQLLSQYGEVMALPCAPNTTGMFRLGWLVTRHHEAIFARLMKGLFASLDRSALQVVLIAPEDSHEYLRHQFNLQPGDELVALAPGVIDAALQVKALALDALHYYEVGTDSQNYLLPFFRLAPKQFTSWGYPVTTGIPTMDAFLSCEAFESAEAEGHYSETLVTLPGVPGVYSKPEASQPLPFLRDRFGFGQGQHIYTCAQNLFKLHPDFDAVVGQILRRDPQGVLVLLQGNNPYWQQQLMTRFDRTLHDVLGQIRFLPRQSPTGYVDLLAASDVILDPLYYGGGSSSIEALGVGTPIITLPGPYQRSRHTAGFYKLMGLHEEGLIVRTPQAFYEKALALGTQPALRQQWQAKIMERNSVLFNNTVFAKAYQAWVVQGSMGNLIAQSTLSVNRVITPTDPDLTLTD
jgi:protein O-GlcNAc transferase